MQEKRSKRYRHALLALGLLFSRVLLAQDHSEHHIVIEPRDSLCLKECFLQARWQAHTRTFFMSTINEGALKDDYALASGAGIGLLTKPLYGFQAGISGFFVYNLWSSDLEKPDPLTLQPNRYEVGLFDVEDPENRNDLDRLEELYIKYKRSRSSITAGKIILNTPFFNPQDGRMRPTIEEGVWISIKESKKIGFNGGWIWDVSPRSTVRWFTLANSLGIYPPGVNPDGQKSGYKGNVKGCSGMAIANIYIMPTERVKISLWNGYLENVMNTAIAEAGFEQQLKKMKLYQNIMLIHQDAVNNGGNADQSKTYITKGAQSNVISAQFGVKKKKVNTTVNYTHITGDGRYLMPREWGRDIFYTFMPRERNEGLGDVHAFMTRTTVSMLNSKAKASIAYGYYDLPDVKNFRLNKYGMPSYHQLNFDLSYSFSKFLEGMDLRFITAYKIRQGETYGNLKYIYNKVDMVNFNLMIDFKI